MEKCLGCPDYSFPGPIKPIIHCNNIPEEGEDFCEECLAKMMSKWINTLDELSKDIK